MLVRRGNYYHYDVTVAGQRMRGTTRQTSESKARKVESRVIADAESKGPSAVLRRAPLLSVFGPRFLAWVNSSRGLAPNTQRYYRLGWKKISSTALSGLTLDRITAEVVDALVITGSPSYVNQFLRTLRRLLGKAVEWKVIPNAARLTLQKEVGRDQIIDPEAERNLIAAGLQPLNDVLISIQDAGMRPDEVFRMRIEHIDWLRQRIFNPTGKTKASRRYVPMSDRMQRMLSARCAGRNEGWVFPSARSHTGRLTTVAKQFREARKLAGLPESLVLYCARHTFGTTVYEETGNLAEIMKVMGHTDVRTAMRYQHPALDNVREVIDGRNSRHNPRHSELRVQ